MDGDDGEKGDAEESNAMMEAQDDEEYKDVVCAGTVEIMEVSRWLLGNHQKLRPSPPYFDKIKNKVGDFFLFFSGA